MDDFLSAGHESVVFLTYYRVLLNTEALTIKHYRMIYWALYSTMKYWGTLYGTMECQHSTTEIGTHATVVIKSNNWSQVTGLLDLMKGHSGHRSHMELTNSFLGSLKWLPKAPKVQKSPPAHLACFGNENCSLMYIYISICIYLWNREFLVDFKNLILQIVTGIQVIINVAWNTSHYVGILQKITTEFP